MNFWQKLSTRLVVVFATVAMSLTAFCFIPTPAEAKVASTSEIHLFMSNEWKTIVNQPTLEVAAAINQRLDIRRDEIGRAILHKIHGLGTYQETEPVLFAPHDGGIYVFRLVIHWDRDLKVTDRKHTTIVDWEVLNNQHYRAVIQSDNSTFAAQNVEELNYLFSQLMVSNQNI
ncbi:hypothetical protein [Nostoc sp. 'Peltigera malacea cyanobiont' DB3992]|uniref:hypothetical protein n=1 Tax=Nostoc sp. 'Peltigera malacea cyanobiont' DB3992 TaxID=1206980 RepID=UPI000C03C0A1|nr:hypothetical protein [Nostoc sp. 'Peltigera malacea cyanobiont' DB3992]PHM10767.1 hypothetical protein CK516_06520 [Nostoc sp. 'Peltigera malacea cyanobiont' DB3992]